MKLIDILVERLPALGGWPIDSDDERALISSLPGVSWGLNGGGYYAFRGPNDSITYQQYEAALVASKPEWDGEGLPPVGCECERSWCGDKWLPCTVLFVSNETIVVKLATREAAYGRCEVAFRPIRSEVERKRDAAVCDMLKFTYGPTEYNYREICEIVYDAIAAGKIPHIRID